MKRAMKLWLAAGTVFMFAAVSCTDPIEESKPGVAHQDKTVEVGLSFRIDGMASGDGSAPTHLTTADMSTATRVIPDGINDGANATIKNLWIIQFEEFPGGVEPTNADEINALKVVGVPRYISPTELNTVKPSVQLIASDACYVIWIANHPDEGGYKWNLSANATFADVAAKMMTISSEASSYQEIDSVPTIMMNAITNSAIANGVSMAVDFKRNFAKVTLEITMPAAASDYAIQSVRLRNIPTNVTLCEQAVEPEYTNIIPNFTNTIYPYGSPMLDYELVTQASASASNPGIVWPYAGSKEDGKPAVFSWYVPRNQQGTREGAANNREKSYYAPVAATYFEVMAQNTVTNENSVFRVYPGADQTEDFNILPNHHYTTRLNVVGIGDSNTVDSRVENFDDVDWTGSSSNCYIINPAPAGGKNRTYTIPITQVNRYWAPSSTAGYGNDDSKVIKDDSQWFVTMLWADYDYQTAGVVISNSNTSPGVGPNAKFTVTVPAGLPAGNFTVGLKKMDSNDILWSWHFWVTDYNPDAFDNNAVASGVYTYPVPNGQVERYADGKRSTSPFDLLELWSDGYADKVMMDRSLGAVENYFEQSFSNNTRGNLHYQFGRKDPFPAMNASTGVITMPVGELTIRLAGEGNASVPVSDGVLNPTKFYNKPSSSGNWASGVDGYNATQYVWHDPNVGIANMGEGTTYVGKSIYDPCPPGWKLPASGTWNDFVYGETTHSELRDLGYTNGRGTPNNVNGVRYWPGTGQPGGRIFYPATGHRNVNTGGLNYVGGSGYYWAAVPSSATTYGRSLAFNSSGVWPVHSHSRGYGFSVRCVSE